MWERIKFLFGFAEQVVTLADKHAKANAIADGAVALFDRIVDQLERSVKTLNEVASEARAQAEELNARADQAVQESINNASRAGKIRDLLV